MRFSLRRLFAVIGVVAVLLAAARVYLALNPVMVIEAPADCDIYVDDTRLGRGKARLSALEALRLGIGRDVSMKTREPVFDWSPFGIHLTQGRPASGHVPILHLRDDGTDPTRQRLWLPGSPKHILILKTHGHGMTYGNGHRFNLVPQTLHANWVCTLSSYDGRMAAVSIELSSELIAACQKAGDDIRVTVNANRATDGQTVKSYWQDFDADTCQSVEQLVFETPPQSPNEQVGFFVHVYGSRGRSTGGRFIEGFASYSLQALPKSASARP